MNTQKNNSGGDIIIDQWKVEKRPVIAESVEPHGTKAGEEVATYPPTPLPLPGLNSQPTGQIQIPEGKSSAQISGRITKKERSTGWEQEGPNQ